MRPLCACLLLTLALPASAEIYRYLDDRGNPVYTNQPPQGVASESVRLGPTNTVAAPEIPPASTTEAPAEGYARLEILGVPTDGETLRANAGRFVFSVALAPGLREGHRLQVLLDGRPLAPAGRQTRFELEAVDRGEHSLQAVVLEEGEEVQRSASVTFTVQRVHIGSPALPRPQPLPSN